MISTARFVKKGNITAVHLIIQHGKQKLLLLLVRNHFFRRGLRHLLLSVLCALFRKFRTLPCHSFRCQENQLRICKPRQKNITVFHGMDGRQGIRIQLILRQIEQRFCRLLPLPYDVFSFFQIQSLLTGRKILRPFHRFSFDFLQCFIQYDKLRFILRGTQNQKLSVCKSCTVCQVTV